MPCRYCQASIASLARCSAVWMARASFWQSSPSARASPLTSFANTVANVRAVSTCNENAVPFCTSRQQNKPWILVFLWQVRQAHCVPFSSFTVVEKGEAKIPVRACITFSRQQVQFCNYGAQLENFIHLPTLGSVYIQEKTLQSHMHRGHNHQVQQRFSAVSRR